MKILKFIWSYIAKSKCEVICAFTILILISILNVFPAIIIKKIFDEGIFLGNFKTVVLGSILLIVIYILVSYLNYKSAFIFNKCSQQIIANLRNTVVQQVMKLPMEFFGVMESGYVTARINEVNNVAGIFSVNTMKVLISIFQFIGICIVLCNINPVLTVLLLLISPSFYILTKKNMKSISSISKIAIEQSAKLNGKIQQSIQGIEEVKNLSVEDKEVKKIEKENAGMLKASIKQSNSYAYGLEIISLINKIASVILIILGGKFVISQTLTVGDYIVFSNYLGLVYAPMQSIASLTITLSPSINSLKRVIEFLDETSEDEDDANKENLCEIKNINFENVCFKYKQQRNMLINALNFNVMKKEKLMIKGKNGCGKTTIFRIILALYSVNSGQVLFNNKNMDVFKKSSIRKKISVVSQKIYLFNGTIEENICYGLDLPKDECESAIKEIAQEGILEQLPLHAGFVVHENGSNLSGGQI